MDPILTSWLERQHEEAMKLAAASDVLTLLPAQGTPPRQYLAHFDSPTLVREEGKVTQHTGFDVFINFPLDYVQSVSDAARVLALAAPRNAFHPNVVFPFICPGHIAPGTSLCELLYQIFSIMTFSRFMPREDDALNPGACAWARNNMHRFPLTSRPLKRASGSLEITEIDPGVRQ